MTEKHERARRELGRWRLIGLLMLLLIPCVLVASVILVQLYDAGSSTSVSMSVPVFAMVFVVVRLMSFECPDCGQSFSRHETRGMHLTNKRCVHCGLDLSGR